MFHVLNLPCIEDIEIIQADYFSILYANKTSHLSKALLGFSGSFRELA